MGLWQRRLNLENNILTCPPNQISVTITASSNIWINLTARGNIKIEFVVSIQFFHILRFVEELEDCQPDTTCMFNPLASYTRILLRHLPYDSAASIPLKSIMHIAYSPYFHKFYKFPPLFKKYKFPTFFQITFFA